MFSDKEKGKKINKTLLSWRNVKEHKNEPAHSFSVNNSNLTSNQNTFHIRTEATITTIDPNREKKWGRSYNTKCD